ncbi:PAS domain S-box protein [bacterium]|nr:PAS domain S-box protein [bacterium]
MSNQDKSKEDLVKELQELKQAHDALKASYEEDINKRKQVKEALSQSESNYRLLAQNSSDVIWTLNNDYRFTYVSPSIYHLRGLTSEEAMCETIQETMTPRSQQIVYEAIVKGKKNEEAKIYLPVRVEIEQYHKDGHKIWVEISLRAMLDDRRKHVGYVGISRYATQRKMAEKALRKGEAKLREINAQKINSSLLSPTTSKVRSTLFWDLVICCWIKSMRKIMRGLRHMQQ